MTRQDKKIIILTVLLIILIFLTILYQIIILRWAQSTFENRYVYEGCGKLVERTDNYGVCLTQEDIIKIVKIKNRWYFDRYCFPFGGDIICPDEGRFGEPIKQFFDKIFYFYEYDISSLP